MARSPDRVKPPTGGQARTRLARREVIAAASALFAEHGFTATTIAALSERSDIPSATVYRLFGSKLGILKAWLDVAVGGDDAPIAVADRPQVTNLLTSTDPRQVIAGFVRVTAAINGRSSGVHRVLVGAAETDPGAAGLLLDIQRQRSTGQRNLTRTLERLGALRAGLKEPRAADIVYALMSPETYRLLVIDRRWSVRHYEEWLDLTLCQQLLDGPEPGERRSCDPR